MENENLKKELDRFGKTFINELTKQLIMADSKATGKLIRSLDYEVIEVLGNYVLSISSEPYLKYVDKGRRKGAKQPPIEPIKKWIEQKPVRRWRDKHGGVIPVNSQAYLIARSISRKGITPTNVIKKSIDKILKGKKNLLEKAFAKDIIKALSINNVFI